MKIEAYVPSIDMTPERRTRYIDWFGNGKFYPDEYNVYSPEQEAEFRKETEFLESQVQAFLSEMQGRTDFYIWMEDGKKQSDYEMLEFVLNNVRDSELRQLVGMSTEKDSIRIDSSYKLYWG